MCWWKPGGRGRRIENTAAPEEWWSIVRDVQAARMEWERAYLMFDEAVGQDQIDYAIYILEAAERKYQIQLKQAKKLGVNRNLIQE